MISQGWLQIALYLVVLLSLARPLGVYMADVYEGRAGYAERVLGPLERLVYRVAGVDATREMRWTRYAAAMLWFNLVGLLVVYTLQRQQQWLPLNPQSLGAVSPDSSFNTAISFATNTNWQGYAGESTMSYLTQMLGLAVQNFVSAATGMATLVALVRGFARKESSTVGNFWADLVRSTVYILLPLSVVFAVVLVSQGVVQTFDKAATVTLVQPVTYDNPTTGSDGQALKDAQGNPVTEKATTAKQTIALGPAASQIAIKQLGTNGGGFYNANSAHPLENPTPLANFLELLAILLIPAALCLTFGRMVKDMRQGWALLAAMTLLFMLFLAPMLPLEQNGNPLLAGAGVDQRASVTQPGGNMEGKEARFGIASSVLWAAATTAASNGSVNSMHDSYTPLAGMMPMVEMQVGEVIFGGVGSGLYGMIVFAIIAVFVAGLMIGRTPEYLGKKIGAFEVKMASIAILIPPLLVLCGTAVGVMTAAGRAGVANPGAQGFSEILYAFSSASNNNGSAFAGLSANTPFYNTALGVSMFFARYWLAIPILALAGSLAAKQQVAPSNGTLPTHTPLFVVVLIGTVLLVAALTFVPALALGPGVEQLLLSASR
ncbi:MAG: potassium-transporting ATPase subunit KdpA [Betaproteobacteria bacterium]